MIRIAAALVLALSLCAPAWAADDGLGTAANAAWLAANAKMPGTILRPSGVQYRVLRSGFGRRAGANDVVRIAYSVKLINGTVVDGSPPSFPSALAVSTLTLAGLAEVLPLMREGDRWLAALPANLALGAAGSGNGAIPPGQTLVLDITLVSAAAPRPGEALPENPFSLWGDGYTSGARYTIRP